MYTNEVVRESSSKFSKVISDYIKTLELNNKQIDSRLAYRAAIEKAKSSGNIEDVLNAKEILKAVDKATEEQIDIINFFVQNGAPDIEQVSLAKEKIASSSGVNDFLDKTKKDVSSKKNIEDSLNECHKITKDEDYSFDYFLRLLEFSPLTEEEKIDVLMKEAYKSCKEGIKKPIRIEEEPQEDLTIKTADSVYVQTASPAKIEDGESVLVAV